MWRERIMNEQGPLREILEVQKYHNNKEEIEKKYRFDLNKTPKYKSLFYFLSIISIVLVLCSINLSKLVIPINLISTIALFLGEPNSSIYSFIVNAFSYIFHIFWVLFFFGISRVFKVMSDNISE